MYYEYNFTSFKEAGWNKIRDKVFDHLLPHQEEWRRIKENDPLRYMPYMEDQFYAATGIRLEDLAGCTAWIKRGSYYHSVVAQRGQLNRCPHLVGIELPRGPQMTPSESCLVSQRKLAPVPLQQRPVPLKGPPLMYLLPWRQGEQAMAASGWNELRIKMILKGVGQRNIRGHSQGDMKTGPSTPSHSRKRREGAPSPRIYTGIRGSSRQLIIMWPPWG